MAQGLKLHLPTADDLFSTQEEREVGQLERVEILSTNLVDDFTDHPFMVRMDAKMVETIESVGQHGILVPCIVRPKADGRYEMVAGHRRKYASTENGILTIPCLVRNLTDDEATIIMVDSNLQREIILPSEKAFAYKMRLEAMKRQGGRPQKGNVSPVGTQFRSDEQLAQLTGDSRTQIRRYISLTKLITELLQMVDDWALKTKDKPKIAMRPAEELAKLPQETQAWVLQAIEMGDCTPSHDQTIRMVKKYEEATAREEAITEDDVFAIMQEEKPNQKETYKLPREQISRFFPESTPVEKIMATIVEALELRQRKLERDRQRTIQGRGGR